MENADEVATIIGQLSVRQCNSPRSSARLRKNPSSRRELSTENTRIKEEEEEEKAGVAKEIKQKDSLQSCIDEEADFILRKVSGLKEEEEEVEADRQTPFHLCVPCDLYFHVDFPGGQWRIKAIVEKK